MDRLMSADRTPQGEFSFLAHVMSALTRAVVRFPLRYRDAGGCSSACARSDTWSSDPVEAIRS